MKYRKKVSVDKAWFELPPGIANTSHMRGVRRAGLTFEKAVGKRLHKLHKEQVLSNIWIGYTSGGETKICSPDHIVVDVEKGVVSIIECKLTHVATAYYQMVNLYVPVIKRLFPGFNIRAVEVCKYYDRSVEYPVNLYILTSFNKDWHGLNNVMVMR